MPNLALVQSINNLGSIKLTANTPYYVQSLLVGGGGSGGNNLGGGGGGGVSLNSYSAVLPTTVYPVVVGASNNYSRFNSQIALQGGYGANGGTGINDILTTGGVQQECSSTAGSGGGGTGQGVGCAGGVYGQAGGNGYWNGIAYQVAAGGGGGFNTSGTNGNSAGGGTYQSGDGGIGYTWYNGQNYSGGGGGGGNTTHSIIAGHGANDYGGGDGKAISDGDTGDVNTGGGGGGGAYGSTGGAGGTGIVVIRYRGPQRGTGGTVISNLSISTLTHVGTTATATASTNTGFQNNDLITISGASPSQYNGTFAITNDPFDGRIFSYTMASSPVSNATGTIVAVSKYAQAISLTHVGTTAICTTGVAYEFQNGDSVTISGASPSAYNGTFAIQATSPSQFKYTMASDPGSNATGTIYATNGNGYIYHYFYSSGNYTA